MTGEPYYSDFGVTVYAGDCFDVLAGLPDASVHAVVTDPPYGLRFMGAAWDGADIEAGVALRRSQAAMPDDGKAGENGGYRSAAAEAGRRYDLSANAAFGEWCRAWATECLRVLKPGGHLLAFGGSRTWHRLAAAVEDAGFEIRDSIAWLYATGFPKSLDVSKALDRAAGAEREVVGRYVPPNGKAWNLRDDVAAPGYRDGWRRRSEHMEVTAPSTMKARQWSGWGTALKPGFEPIVVARKPLAGTVIGNVLEYGVGALNIDACRIESGSAHAAGRWPTNVVATHAATPGGVDLCVDGCVPGCPVRDLDEQSIAGGMHSAGRARERGQAVVGDRYNASAYEMPSSTAVHRFGDTGGASRFFPVFRYGAKAPTAERPRVDGVAHPTVKPLALMRWLARLVTPPGGTVLDPFLGSGTTAQAARAEGFQCIGVERDETYLPLIRARLDGSTPDLFGGVA